ncbi:MAG TPA: hypothetical protein VF017_08470 [Thermoanaerobaculia bacterium]|nr:hypothetical protein [Thermoanaerobaculia bacterium]
MKRRSATRPSRPPPDPVFFTDRDLGKQFPGILAESGLRVERYFDHFQSDRVADEDWLAFVAHKGWVAISHDDNIRRDPVAVATVLAHGGRLFIVRGELTTAQLAELFLSALPAVRSILGKHRLKAFIGVVRRRSTKGAAFHAEAKVVVS